MKKLQANNNPKAYALVDNDVYEIIQDMGLKFCINNYGRFYSTKWIKLPGMSKKKQLYLHHFVWVLRNGELPNKTIDHIDRDPGNNKFSNLRLASSQEQSHNRSKLKSNTSGFIGVSHLHDKRRNGYHYWKVSIRNPNGHHEAKTFPFTDEGLLEAAKYYDQKAKQYFGKFAVTNFPDDHKTA